MLVAVVAEGQIHSPQFVPDGRLKYQKPTGGTQKISIQTGRVFSGKSRLIKITPEPVGGVFGGAQERHSPVVSQHPGERN
jgi:hypothetical protein